MGSSDDMSIEAVVTDVQRAADEPLGERKFPFTHGVPWVEPRDEFASLPRPKRLVVLVGFVVQVRPGNKCALLETL